MAKSYTDEFFEAQQGGSRESAQRVVPAVLELASPRSVVDVGCGVGTWLSVFADLGIQDVIGLDGDYVNREMLQIPRDRFRPVDLAAPFKVDRQFDLAISLEVAEHLPKASAAGFVSSVCQLAPVILFSAAIPHQVGTSHLNLQWPEYWSDLFAEQGYLPVDCLRMRFWQDFKVDWWYAQNMFLLVRENASANYPLIQQQLDLGRGAPLSIVHPILFDQVSRPSLRTASRMFLIAARNAIRRRLRIMSAS